MKDPTFSEAKAVLISFDYRFKDWLGIRAGRVKIPFGLYNDSSDVDSARVPILLPQSLYPTLNRDFLLAQTGGQARLALPIPCNLWTNAEGGSKVTAHRDGFLGPR